MPATNGTVVRAVRSRRPRLVVVQATLSLQEVVALGRRAARFVVYDSAIRASDRIWVICERGGDIPPHSPIRGRGSVS